MACEKFFGPVTNPDFFFRPFDLRKGYSVSVDEPLIIPGEKVQHEMVGIVGQAAAHKVLIGLQQSRNIG